MLKKKTFVTKNRQGGVSNVVREHYLRDDIPCGYSGCKKCSTQLVSTTLSDAYPFIIVADTNVFLHQIDVIEHPHVKNVVLLQTVLDEVKHRNLALYNRIRQMSADPSRHFYVFSNEFHRATYIEDTDSIGSTNPSETANDRNDRAIRVTAKWYSEHLRIPVLLLSDDRRNRQLFADEQGAIPNFFQEDGSLRGALVAASVSEFVEAQKASVPDLGERVKNLATDGTAVENTSSSSDAFFQEYTSAQFIQSGLQAGQFLKGVVRCYRDSPYDGRLSGVIFNNMPVRIHGKQNMNRAFDGDTVAVEIILDAAIATDADEASEKQTRQAGAHIASDVPSEETDGELLKQDVRARKYNLARVVGVFERKWRPYCGYLTDSSKLATSQSVLFEPLDARIPRIRIKTRQASSLAGKLFVVAVDEWPVDSRYPNGHYVQTIGDIGDRDAENEAILREHDVPHTTFSESVLSCLPADDWIITDAERSKRKDLRMRNVASIDPPGCKDIDDALHVQRVAKRRVDMLGSPDVRLRSLGPRENLDPLDEEEEELLEVGVHIADVSHFLKLGTAMDEEAQRRSTTVYLVDKRIDMLPGLLTETLCSLKGGVERLAFSVLWYLEPGTFKIRHVEYCKSVIKSRAAMTYGEAQCILDAYTSHMADPENRHNAFRLDGVLPPKFVNQHANIGGTEILDPETIGHDVSLMMSISEHFKALRFGKGALSLASSEVRFSLDAETHNPTDVSVYQTKRTNSLVEEFMLLGNCAVAEKIAQSFPAIAILRRHPCPEPQAFDSLERAARIGLGYDWFRALASLDPADPKSSKILNNCMDRVPNPQVQRLLRMLATRCMQQAVYFCAGDFKKEQWRHYGLAADLYTHFTSPIRRYSDVLVHRLLAAALELIPLSDVVPTTDRNEEEQERMKNVVDNLNHRHLQAQLAGRDSVELHTVMLFRDRGEDTQDAIVLGLQEQASHMSVFVPRYGIEGKIDVHGQGFVFDSETLSMTCNEQGQKISVRMFDRVRVKIEAQKRTLAISWVERSDVQSSAKQLHDQTLKRSVDGDVSKQQSPPAKRKR
eukprot:ANDGO_03997.mRNA.1 Exosome complex exonuclease RRP44 homolog A